MKKLLPIILFSLFIVPVLTSAAIVPCNGTDCTISSFFTMLGNIYRFIVLDIATPLAIIALVVGAIFMMISAGNPNMMARGKQIITLAIIGLALVFGSYLIIDFIMQTIGYQANWKSF